MFADSKNVFSHLEKKLPLNEISPRDMNNLLRDWFAEERVLNIRVALGICHTTSDVSARFEVFVKQLEADGWTWLHKETRPRFLAEFRTLVNLAIYHRIGGGEMRSLDMLPLSSDPKGRKTYWPKSIQLYERIHSYARSIKRDPDFC